MNDALTDFLEFFNLTDLLEITSETPVSAVVGLIVVAFISMVFCIIGVKVIMEFIKIFLDYRRLR